MPRVSVTEIGKKFQVLVNGIREGAVYSTEAIAKSEASKIKKEIEDRYAPRP